MSEDDIICVSSSGNWSKGWPAGLEILIRKDRILGRKKVKYSYFTAFNGKNPPLPADSLMKMYEIAGEVEKKRDFEILKEEISSIIIKEPGLWGGGKITIKSSRGDIEIKTTPKGNCMKELLILVRALVVFAPDKTYLETKTGSQLIISLPKSVLPERTPESFFKTCVNCGKQIPVASEM